MQRLSAAASLLWRERHAFKEMHQVGVSTATVQRAFSWPPPEDQAEYVSHVQHAGIHTFSLQQEEVKATVSR